MIFIAGDMPKQLCIICKKVDTGKSSQISSRPTSKNSDKNSYVDLDRDPDQHTKSNVFASETSHVPSKNNT